MKWLKVADNLEKEALQKLGLAHAKLRYFIRYLELLEWFRIEF